MLCKRKNKNSPPRTLDLAHKCRGPCQRLREASGAAQMSSRAKLAVRRVKPRDLVGVPATPIGLPPHAPLMGATAAVAQALPPVPTRSLDCVPRRVTPLGMTRVAGEFVGIYEQACQVGSRMLPRDDPRIYSTSSLATRQSISSEPATTQSYGVRAAMPTNGVRPIIPLPKLLVSAS